MTNRKIILIMGAVILALIAVIAVLLFGRNGETQVSPLPERPPQQGEEKADPGAVPIAEDNRISVPGYEKLDLTAGKTEQSLALPNPENNTCVMVLTLSLEDGTVLWTSGEILPGQVSDPIVLTEPLAAGDYTGARLHYDCFTMDESRGRLNSAEIKLTLAVH